MRLATVEHKAIMKAGIVSGDVLHVRAAGDRAAHWVADVVAAGYGAAGYGAAGYGAAGDSANGGSPAGGRIDDAALEEIPLGEVSWLPPIPFPRSALICVGKNYHAHAKEFQRSGFDATGSEDIPANPVIFTKATTSVIGAGQAVNAALDPTGTVDYEGELGVIIGRKAFRVAPDDVLDHVFGYTIINDVTSRELQKKHRQWFIGKSLDTFAPIGPWIITADEIGDVTALELETRINGEVRQKAVVRDLIFDIPTIISTLSATQTLMPGDIIATGTPAGVGIGFAPPKYLKAGDRMAVSISGIGVLENPVI